MRNEIFEMVGSIEDRDWREDKQNLRDMLSRNDAVIINVCGTVGIAYITKLVSFLHDDVDKVTLQARKISHEDTEKAVVTFTVYPSERIAFFDDRFGGVVYEDEEDEYVF